MDKLERLAKLYYDLDDTIRTLAEQRRDVECQLIQAMSGTDCVKLKVEDKEIVFTVEMKKPQIKLTEK